MDEIRQLLEKADNARTHNNLDEAERLYREVTIHSQIKRESDEFQRAAEGIKLIRRQRHASASQPDTGPLVANNEHVSSAGLTTILPSEDGDVPTNNPFSSAGLTTIQVPRDRATSGDSVSYQPVAHTSTPAQGATTVQEESVHEQLESLENQAKSYLAQPTTANYKQAISLYERILDFGTLSADQRTTYDQKLREIKEKYEDFRAQFGELTTARMVANREGELISIRKQQLAGVQTGPDGEDLAERFQELISSVRETIQKITGERVEQAEQQTRDGMAFLDVSQLTGAVERFDEAIRQIQSDEIPAPDTSDETRQAIAFIKNILINNDIQKTLATYHQRRAAVYEIRNAVERVRPLYDEADRFFKQEAYSKAVEALESVQERVGKDFDSTLLTGLRQRARQRWEERTCTQADQLLAKARSALQRQELQVVETCVNDVLGLEPHLKTERLESYRHQARAMLEQIGSVEKQFGDTIAQAGEALARGNIAEAERLARQVLVQRPDHKNARTMLDTVLYTMVNNALRESDRALSSTNEHHLVESRDALTAQHNHMHDISDATTRRRLTDRVEETLNQINRAIQRLADERGRQERVHTHIQRASEQARRGEFEQALQTLDEARAIDPNNIEIANHADTIRPDWIDALKAEARKFLNAYPPDPDAALQALNRLSDMGIDDPSSSALRRQTERLTHKQRGLARYKQGDHQGAIKELMQADPDDPDVRTTLEDSRYKEVHRLMELAQWDEALGILQHVDSTNQKFTGLTKRTRAESLLLQVQHLLDKRDFDAAAHRLSDVEQLQLSYMVERIEPLRNQIQSARNIFSRIHSYEQDAEMYFKRYETNKNRDELRRAIEVLDQALALPSSELPADDPQRSGIQKKRTDYQETFKNSMTSERQQLLEGAEKALADETLAGIQEAIRLYDDVLNIDTQRKDSDAEKGKEKARLLFQQLCDKLIARSKTLLNLDVQGGQPRGIQPSEVKTLLDNMTEAYQLSQQIDPGMQRELTRTQSEIQNAHDACIRAERSLQDAYARWADIRQEQHGKFEQIVRELEQIRNYFSGKTYTHVELDWSSPENIQRRVEKDRDAQKLVTDCLREINSLVDRLDQNDIHRIKTRFDELTRAEETIYDITCLLSSRVTRMTLPQTTIERYPKQYGILMHVFQKSEGLKQQEHETSDIGTLCQAMEQRKYYQHVLETLDPTNRFELYHKEYGHTVDIRQIQEWVQSYTKGNEVYTQAVAYEEQATQSQESKQWRAGIEQYRQAQATYEQAVKALEPVAIISDVPYKAVQHIRNDAGRKRTHAQEKLTAFEKDKPGHTYEQHMKEAVQLLAQARQALRDDDFSDAKLHMEEACAKDPFLQNDEEVLRIKSDLRLHERSQKHLSASQFPVLPVVFVLIVIILLIVFGPMLWTWISEFLFPAEDTLGSIPFK